MSEGSIVFFKILLEQESPPARTQEAYRPPCSKYSFCCPIPGGGGGYPIPRLGGTPCQDRGYPGNSPPPRCEQTENITFPILRMRAATTIYCLLFKSVLCHQHITNNRLINENPSDNKIDIIIIHDSSVLIETACVINVIRNKLLLFAISKVNVKRSDVLFSNK